MEFPFQKIVIDENETANIASTFARTINTGDVVCLNGNLGSGKTFFVKSICKEFGVDTTTSPSFAIVNEYSGSKKIIHIDFYRLKNINELHDIGFQEYLQNDDSIVFIEWANMFEEVLPKKYYAIEIKQVDETIRHITIEHKK